MGHDIFVSHSTRDKAIADAVVARLEQNGLRCWVAPRDILPGSTWAGAIVDAVAASRVLLLIFSGHADRSQHVLREVQVAVEKRIIVFPFRVEEVVPSRDLKFFLGTPHWMDAITPPLERHLGNLAATLRMALDLPPAPQVDPPPQKKPDGRRLRQIGMAGLALVVMTAAFFGIADRARWSAEAPARPEQLAAPSTQVVAPLFDAPRAVTTADHDEAVEVIRIALEAADQSVRVTDDPSTAEAKIKDVLDVLQKNTRPLTKAEQRAFKRQCDILDARLAERFPLMTDPNSVQLLLTKVLPELRLENIAINDCLDFLHDMTQMEIEIDWIPMEMAGIDRNVPVTIKRRDISVGTMLRLILEAADPDNSKTGWWIDGRTLRISTRKVADTALLAKR